MRKIKNLAAFFIVAALLSMLPVLIVSADVTLPGPSELQQQTNDFASNAWQSDANRDMGYTTLKKSGATDRRLVSTKSFSGAFKVKFTVHFHDTSSWNSSAAKSLFTLSLSSDENGAFTDLFVIYEQSIITGGNFYLEPANNYPAILWQQGGINGAFTEATGQSFDFMFDVKGDGTADVFIEKYGTPLTVSRYTAIGTQADVFDGHIAFESGASGFVYDIGSLSVEYTEQGMQKTFNSHFDNSGAITRAQDKTADTTFITNYTDGNTTRRETTQRLKDNEYLYSNFVMTGSSFTVEYELTGIINGNPWNNADTAIEFVGGITEEKPSGILLGRAYKNRLSLGDHSWQDASIADHVNPGKFIDSTKYKFKIQSVSGSYQVYIAAFIGGSYGDYVPFSTENETFTGEAGRIGIRACSPQGSAPVTFKVALISLTGTVSEEIFLGTPNQDMLTPSYSGTFNMLLPQMPVFNPANAGERAVWSMESSDIATLSGNTLTITDVGTLQLKLSAQSDPSVFKVFTVTIADGTPPVIKAEQEFVVVQSKALTESEFWDNISVTDNVSEDIVPLLEDIQYYASLTDALNKQNGESKTFTGNTLQLQAGVYVFTVSAADDAGNESTMSVTYFVDAIMLAGIDYSGLEYKGEVIKVDLPEVSGLGGDFVFEVRSGNAYIGNGGNVGKLLIFGDGLIELVVINTVIPDLRSEFSFVVADKTLPIITPYLPASVKIGTLNAKIVLDNMFEFSPKTDMQTVVYSVDFFRAKEDMQQDKNAVSVTLADNKFTADNAGWYRIIVNAKDSLGNQTTKVYQFEASGADNEPVKSLGLFHWLSIASGAAALAAACYLAVITIKGRKDRG